jgi:hypothetical protein
MAKMRAIETTAIRPGVLLLMMLLLTALLAGPAHALPAYAAQTGQPCQMCHVGGFGPQLTPYGRNFKIHGYTQRAKDAGLTVPLSLMAVASFVHTAKDQPPPPHYSANDNATIDEVSVFLAGGFGQHFGTFIQGTYEGIDRHWTWDNIDVRAVTTTTVRGHDVVLGASLNNNPTVSDPWNSLPAWGFPYTTSDLAPAPGTSIFLDGALAQKALGATFYAWIDNAFYVEAGAYGWPGQSTLRGLGADPSDPGQLHGLAPHGRLAYQRNIAGGTAHIGAFVMNANIHPGLDKSTGFTDGYTDAGVDGSYQKPLAHGDLLSFNARYTHEWQSRDASCALAEADTSCTDNHLDDVRADVSYYWRSKIGGSVQVFNTSGDANPFLYPDSRKFRPDSTGFVFQIDGTPFGDRAQPARRLNLRLGLQYVLYTRFNGAGSNFDGAGANASDNDSLRVFGWLAF